MAVVTGGGTGMGRELVQQLAAAGCHVAMCDVSEPNMLTSKENALKHAPDGVRVTTHICDVAVEEQMKRFRDEVEQDHGKSVNLLLNNAGIGGGGSFINEPRDVWEKTFAVCWYGVYYSCREFMPMVLASDEGHIVNTSSVNGFWASLGPDVPHTSYSAAKFAVKGFTEALVNDLRLNAPHVACSVVMPGHIGTDIAINSSLVLGRNPALEMTEEEVRGVRENMMRSAGPASEAIMNMSDDQIRQAIHDRGVQFRENAPTSAAEAATIILDGVKARRWRILVGADAARLDQKVRANPEQAYERDFEGLRLFADE